MAHPSFWICCSRLAVMLALAAPVAAQEVELYEHIDFGGKSLRILEGSSLLDRAWNDRVSSLRVRDGKWEICRHSEFRDCRTVDGDLADLRSLGWNDVISSLRPMTADPAASSAGGAAAEDAREHAEASSPAPSRAAADIEGSPAAVNGYAEYRTGDALVVEGQRVVVGPKTRIRGEGDAGESIADIPLGYMVEASGERRADGAIVAERIAAKPNGQQMFESDIKQATDQLEAAYRQAGQFLMANGSETQSLGKLYESGPDVDRVRRVVDRLLPPYIEPAAVRVYVIDNPEWNAMAMGNFSIYVFTGLLHEIDDDELAIVLGHEIAHASHEHSRKQQRRGMLTQIGATAAGVAVGATLDGTEAQVAGTLAALGAVAFSNGYSREHEDQADRVGMRYAYEAGYDVSKGPRLWQRFAEKYGEPGKAQNILFGDHSRSSVRAAALEREIVINYSVAVP
jgi:Zn-dependent protease with chaperone function